MSAHANDRIAYYNGGLKPENEVLPSIRHQGFLYGSYRNMIVADHAAAANTDIWAVLLDMHGSNAEGRGSDTFPVEDGRLATSRAHRELSGISQQAMIELAGDLGIPCDETDLNLYDAYSGDEAFLTSTSLCICPVRSINGSRVGSEQVFGTITRRLIEAHVQLVDGDFVVQYRRQLD